MSTSASPGTVNTMLKFGWKTRICYAMSDFGCNFSWQYVASFLMIFYTDVFGIKAAVVSVLILIARLWDALNDPVVGALADRTKHKLGRYRPWILYGALPCGIFTILVYWAHPAWGDSAKIIYAFVTYCILVLAYTCVNLPMGTLAGVMTQDIDERSKLTTIRMFAAMLAIGLLNTFAPMIVGYFTGNAAPGDVEAKVTGWLVTSIIFGIIFSGTQFFTVFGCKEVVGPSESQKSTAKIPLGKMFMTSMKNTEFIKVFLLQAVMGFNVYGRIAIYSYYFTYYAGDFSKMALFSAVGIIPSILGAALFDVVYQKVGSKGKVGMWGYIVAGILCCLTFFINPNTNWTLFLVIAFIYAITFGFGASAIYGVIPDSVEYGEWKTGERNDGFQYAFISFMNKFGIAIGNALLMVVLSVVGYVPNVEQSDTVRLWLNLLMTFIPGVFYFVGAALFGSLKVNRATFAQMLKDIEAKKAHA
jgi:sugar (glycoside-pentoside-hexuronide) transporter